ncbi:RDD family protein [Candidatus Poribacteria bacterium]|nr:RDD family protein [Candidatus Poribacteria bacterium]
MFEQLSVETPEQISINYQKAGIGSRFYAALLDTIILCLILFLGLYVNQGMIEYLSAIFGNWLGAIGGIIVFAMFWGYYMIFEIATNGQSPGKYVLELRVIKDGGYPINFSDSAIRNLVRLADFMPFFYGIGLIVMLFSPNWQRLGDLAAGTLVVKTPRKKSLSSNYDLNPDVPDYNVPIEEFQYKDWIQLDMVTNEELIRIGEFLSRSSSLLIDRRFELARAIAAPLVDKMGGYENIRYDIFLKELYKLKTIQETQTNVDDGA